ncbi:ABC transporter ATP-binding protein [Aurantimonas sp. VKM B-3413]|uniref:ABC transporter ATP-binding protein n=1 Tax=Aurantimonas sp. VKM B-3413 TaxID=2779401 RepID=UPI001E4FC6D2|nr:sn-glycerol-3-phosphate ABC transporter ATP-binding protein UgpC [Aurantimonas sp. VKM B-3413]MCB8840410.1 sn-glycerol-3-phosphate ABC transporter ATP-binding protein UgpC [Aurantimonas sp. VKM B-3413]
MSTLELAGIRKRYGNLETLKGIDLTLESGEFLVLLGPSGCGKSTLLNIIAGLLEPSAGEVRIDGRAMTRVHPKNRDIAMVFQSYALYPNLTVARNIGFGLEMRKVAKAEREAAVKKAAEILQIEPLLGRKPSELSGGQRQRVAIGRALVRDPKVFLFDEPLSNLDAKLRTEMRTELKRLHQQLKATVVYVTHDQVEAMTLATRIAVMRQGRVEQVGAPKAIYDHPANLYVAGFMGSPPMNVLTGTVAPEGDIWQADGAEGRVAIPHFLRARLQPGQALTLGVRPERLQIAAGEGAADLVMDVEVTELTGAETLVIGSVGGQPLIGSVEPELAPRPGERLPLVFREDALRWFDAETGEALADTRGD